MCERNQSQSLVSSCARIPEYDGAQEQQGLSFIAGVSLRNEVWVARFKWCLRQSQLTVYVSVQEFVDYVSWFV